MQFWRLAVRHVNYS